ncbi:MAG: hypothetical protein AMXMBFR81_14160 [Chthonomonas sp.]
MAKPLVCGDVDDVFEKACETDLFGKVDQLGVTRDDRVIGVCAGPVPPGVTLGAAMEPLRSDMLVSANTPVLGLFGEWKHHFYLVVEGTDFVGIVTPSDLNRVPVYASLYDVLASYEERLTQFLEAELKSQNDCLNHLSAEEQEKTLTLFDKLKSRNLEINLVRALPLGLKHKVLLKVRADEGIGKLTAPITKLRNKIAHLTPFIEAAEDVRAVANSLGSISLMERKLDGWLEIRSPDRRGDFGGVTMV